MVNLFFLYLVFGSFCLDAATNQKIKAHAPSSKGEHQCTAPLRYFVFGL
jgi:hypothetical protein